jgi:hypothetical protein
MDRVRLHDIDAMHRSRVARPATTTCSCSTAVNDLMVLNQRDAQHLVRQSLRPHPPLHVPSPLETITVPALTRGADIGQNRWCAPAPDRVLVTGRTQLAGGVEFAPA